MRKNTSWQTATLTCWFVFKGECVEKIRARIEMKKNAYLDNHLPTSVFPQYFYSSCSGLCWLKIFERRSSIGRTKSRFIHGSLIHKQRCQRQSTTLNFLRWKLMTNFLSSRKSLISNIHHLSHETRSLPCETSSYNPQMNKWQLKQYVSDK